MPQAEAAFWSEQLKQTLERYDVALLRQVADKLYKPRSQWPADELIERSLATVGNAAVIDRRLQALEPRSRRLLAFMAHSRQPCWRLGSLVEVGYVLEKTADIEPVMALFEAGLLYPVLPERVTRFKSFEQWLGLGMVSGPEVFAHPDVLARALGEDLGLPELAGVTLPTTGIHESDGLEWPLRLAVLWQQVSAGPLRRTQQGDFFKRDLERLRSDPLLNDPPPDSIGDLPDTGLLVVELALVEGVLEESDGELRALPQPPAWDAGVLATLTSLWSAIPRLQAWNPHAGWQGGQPGANPFPSAHVLALLLLARLPADQWADPENVGQWLLEHHPFWVESEATTDEESNGDSPKLRERKREKHRNQTRAYCQAFVRFLLGLAYQMRMLQAAKDDQGKWFVRLSPTGRWLLGLGDAPSAPASYPQTLMVQPNLEIIAYRQALTPALVARLGQFAAWKNLGSACMLQLQPDSVYRALESGMTFESIRQTLEQHGMRQLPTAVIESLRTWSNKRERLGVYPSATLFEFATAEELNEALARGLPGTRLSDRLAVVTDESGIDFRHFRLTGTRDYGLPPEKCVEVAEDGVTLSIDMTKSDLMLDTELQRFAELCPSVAGLDPRTGKSDRRQYRLTPASLAAGRESGITLGVLEEWSQQRTGAPLTAAARLLMTGGELAAPQLRTQRVLHVAAADVADGLLQWPQTRALIQDRLGPTALAVADEQVEELRQRLDAIGVKIVMGHE